MRPTHLAALAVSAVALVGCSAAEPNTAPATSPADEQSTPTPTVAKTLKPVQSTNPNAQIEKQFAEFAESRAAAHGVSETPAAKDTTKALHSYCEDGTRIKVSKSQVLNNNLEASAEKGYCDFLQ